MKIRAEELIHGDTFVTEDGDSFKVINMYNYEDTIKVESLITGKKYYIRTGVQSTVELSFRQHPHIERAVFLTQLKEGDTICFLDLNGAPGPDHFLVEKNDGKTVYLKHKRAKTYTSRNISTKNELVYRFQATRKENPNTPYSCPDCKGTGQYVGFTVVEPCRSCNQ